MEQRPAPIGWTLLLTLLGLPIALVAGLYWRYFPPREARSGPRPVLTAAPIIAEAAVKG